MQQALAELYFNTNYESVDEDDFVCQRFPPGCHIAHRQARPIGIAGRAKRDLVARPRGVAEWAVCRAPPRRRAARKELLKRLRLCPSNGSVSTQLCAHSVSESEALVTSCEGHVGGAGGGDAADGGGDPRAHRQGRVNGRGGGAGRREGRRGRGGRCARSSASHSADCSPPGPAR